MTEESRQITAARQLLRSLHQSGVQQIPKPPPPSKVADHATAPPTQAVKALAITHPQVSNVVAGAANKEPDPSLLQMESSHNPMARMKKSERIQELSVLSEKVAGCTACAELASQRTQTVFGVGDPNARLCFLGEAPGADEDRLGEPFVGRAGQLLTKIIEAMTLTRDDVYILNTLKCRPPGNRNPKPEEVANCRPFFEQQLDLIQPEFICCLGSVAAQNLLDTKISIGKLRGEFHDWNGRKVLATYHPAYLLRNPPAKKYVWEDMQILMKAMGIAIPKKSN